MKTESNFLKEELKRIDDQIGNYSYGGNIKKLKRIVKLWEFRRDIVNEVGKETSKTESSFLKAELERIEAQIKAYKYGGDMETLNTVTELYELRKIIVEEIKKIIEARGPQIRRV